MKLLHCWTADSCVAVCLQTNAVIPLSNAKPVCFAAELSLPLGHPILRQSAQGKQRRSAFYGGNVLDQILIKQMGNDYLLSGSNQRLYMCSETVKWGLGDSKWSLALCPHPNLKFNFPWLRAIMMSHGAERQQGGPWSVSLERRRCSFSSISVLMCLMELAPERTLHDHRTLTWATHSRVSPACCSVAATWKQMWHHLPLLPFSPL